MSLTESTGTTARRGVLARLTALLALTFVALMAALPAPARADGTDNEVGACLAADKVWLLITTETDEVIANECVGNPATGDEAIANAGVPVVLGDMNMICTLGGHPAECPKTFAGAYWAYYQGEPGKEYAYAQVGPAEAKPVGGTIEAWCYATDNKECTPPQLKIVQGGTEVAPPAGTTAVDLKLTGAAASPSPTAQPTADASQVPAPAEPTGSAPWGWIIGGVAVLAVIVGAVLWLRARGGGKGAVGGR